MTISTAKRAASEPVALQSLQSLVAAFMINDLIIKYPFNADLVSLALNYRER
jgi:hypothetical protein